MFYELEPFRVEVDRMVSIDEHDAATTFTQHHQGTSVLGYRGNVTKTGKTKWRRGSALACLDGPECECEGCLDPQPAE